MRLAYQKGEKARFPGGCALSRSKGTPYTLKNPCQEVRQLSVWVPEKTRVDSQRFEWPLIVHDGDGEPPKRFSEGKGSS